MLKNEEIDELVIERLNQIYKKLSESKEIKKIKEEENFVGRKLEKVLKESNNQSFKYYCKYEEIQSKYMSKLNKEYYKQGIKDGINLIIEAKNG